MEKEEKKGKQREIDRKEGKKRETGGGEPKKICVSSMVVYKEDMCQFNGGLLLELCWRGVG